MAVAPQLEGMSGGEEAAPWQHRGSTEGRDGERAGDHQLTWREEA